MRCYAWWTATLPPVPYWCKQPSHELNRCAASCESLEPLWNCHRARHRHTQNIEKLAKRQSIRHHPTHPHTEHSGSVSAWIRQRMDAAPTSTSTPTSLRIGARLPLQNRGQRRCHKRCPSPYKESESPPKTSKHKQQNPMASIYWYNYSINGRHWIWIRTYLRKCE